MSKCSNIIIIFKGHNANEILLRMQQFFCKQIILKYCGSKRVEGHIFFIKGMYHATRYPSKKRIICIKQPLTNIVSNIHCLH